MGSRTRFAALLAALATVAIMVGGCGSSAGTPSSLDPAQIAPANSVAYLELAVRPQGSQRQGAESGLTKLLGYSPDAHLQQLITGLLKGSHLNYQTDIKPWLGQKLGLVFTGFSRSGFALIAPTNDPSAALSALKKGESNAKLTSHTFDGVSYEQGVDSGTPVALGIVGKNAVIGGPEAFDAIAGSAHGGSLEDQAAFTSAFGRLPSNALVRGWASGPGTIVALRSISTLPPSIKQELQSGLFHGGKVPTAITLAASVTGSAVTAEVGEIGGAASSGSSADVSKLPGGSWLALSTGNGLPQSLTGGLSADFTEGFDRAAKLRGLNPSTLMNALQQRLGINIQRDLLPALGGIQLSIQGTSLLAVGAGLILHPQNSQAATRLLADIHNIVAHSSGLSVSGSPKSFTVTKPGLPIPRVIVSQTSSQVIATVDEPFAAITSPASTLQSDAVFQRARGQLVSGSVVPMFINFGDITSLLSQTPDFSSDPSNAKALAVLRRLDYFVLGFDPAAGEAQFVLGLN